jgi:hypothetical protein
LTGQQYWGRQECTTRAPRPVPNAKTCTEPLQTKDNSASTWEPHRGTSVISPGYHRPPKGVSRAPGRASVHASPNIRRHPRIQGARGRSPFQRRRPLTSRAGRTTANRGWRWVAAEPQRGQSHATFALACFPTIFRHLAMSNDLQPSVLPACRKLSPEPVRRLSSSSTRATDRHRNKLHLDESPAKCALFTPRSQLFAAAEERHLRAGSRAGR